MADNEKLQAELQVLRAENAQLKDELQKLTATQSEKKCVPDSERVRHLGTPKEKGQNDLPAVVKGVDDSEDALPRFSGRGH